MINKRKLLGMIAIALLGSGGTGPVLAQTSVGATALEEVVVTATRRETSLQDMNMSIVALSEEDLEMRSIGTLEGLQGTIPNLMVFGDTAGGQTGSLFTVRGIPRVGVYIDGIWQPFTAGLMDMALQNIERVEVLRGPQGTLYGRDSTGGAIRIVTKEPAKEFGGTASVTVGTHDRLDLEASLDIPLSDTLRSRVSVAKMDQDGYVESLSLDEDLGQVDKTIISGDLLWEPNDQFYARAKYTYTESHPTEARVSLWADDEGSHFVGFEEGMISLYSLAGHPYGADTHVAGHPGGELGQWQTRSNQGEPWDVTVKQASLEMGFDLTDDISIKSWTAYVDQHSNGVVDYDNSQYDAVTVWSYRENRIFSQELQVSGTHGPLDWVAGAYYWTEDNGSRDLWWGFEEFQSGEFDQTVALNSPACTAPTTRLGCAGAFGVYQSIGDQDEIVKNEEEGYALFTDITYNITDRLEATFGARYHDQDVNNRTLAPVPGVTGIHPDEIGPVTTGDPIAGSPDIVIDSSFDSFTMRGVLRYNFTDDIMSYASYSEGFNAGGAAAVEVPGGRELIPYDPEEITSYELGLRSNWLDNRLQLNAWLFHTQWDNIQLEAPYVNPDIGVFAVTFITQNAAGAEANGLEIEANWLVSDRLKLNAGFGWLDTKYTDFNFGADTAVQSGDDFRQAPETTFNVGAQYRTPFPLFSESGRLTGRVDYSYVSGFQRYEGPSLHPENVGLEDLLGEFEAGSYGTLNARLVYKPSENANWQMSLIGTNLTDEQYTNGGFYSPIWEIDMSTVARPREFAVQLKTFF